LSEAPHRLKDHRGLQRLSGIAKPCSLHGLAFDAWALPPAPAHS